PHPRRYDRRSPRSVPQATAHLTGRVGRAAGQPPGRSSRPARLLPARTRPLAGGARKSLGPTRLRGRPAADGPAERPGRLRVRRGRAERDRLRPGERRGLGIVSHSFPNRRGGWPRSLRRSALAALRDHCPVRTWTSSERWFAVRSTTSTLPTFG